jgi:nickel-dependent lactate racemase
MIHTFRDISTIHVPYGDTAQPIGLPAGTTAIVAKEPKHQISTSLFRSRLEHSITAANLDLTRPILVVTDKTRLCDYPIYLPIVVEIISRRRKSHKPFPIIIAYGTHPRQSEQECLQTYGKIYQEWPFIHHDCRNSALFTQIGTTSFGTPVRMRKDLLQATSIMTMGPICHHYFAGYGGGRKLIFPGCGEREAIYHNHGLFLDRQKSNLNAQCQPGNLQQNPLADDLFEMQDHLPAQLAIHGIQDSKGTIADFIIGADKQSYLDACSIHASYYEVDAPLFDTVIASCGGYPKDINFIQAHKAIHNSARFVRDQGRLIVFAECRDGIGSQTFLPWYCLGGFDQAFALLAERYEGNGGTALAMMNKCQRISISLVTSIDQHTCSLLGVDKWNQKTVESYLSDSPGSAAWMYNASLVVNRYSA